MQSAKRLIEVDLPIKRISEHARMEKNIRQGHISTIHIWWARRPLAACRAVVCASAWPDPVDAVNRRNTIGISQNTDRDRGDEIANFLKEAHKQMIVWAKEGLSTVGTEAYSKLQCIAKDPHFLDSPENLQSSLLNFIAEYSKWENSQNQLMNSIARSLTNAAYMATTGTVGTSPTLLDSFAGSGAIPIEGLRIGMHSISGELNPVALMINKLVLQYIPKYGKRLAVEVQKQGELIQKEAHAILCKYYPVDQDRGTPIAYIWARTIICEGPGCGATIPVIRNLWLAKKGRQKVALRMVADLKLRKVNFEIVYDPQMREISQGTVHRGSVLCPCCGFTTSAERVRNQFVPRSGGANDAQIVTVVTTSRGMSGRRFRLPNEEDYGAFALASETLTELSRLGDKIDFIPKETLPYLRSIFNINLLGVNEWGKLFNNRQLLALTTYVDLIKKCHQKVLHDNGDKEFADAVVSSLAMTLSKLTDVANSLCAWEPNVVTVQHLFGRQSMGIIWDYAEGCPIGDSRGSWNVFLHNTCALLERYGDQWITGDVLGTSATSLPLPDNSVDLFITDPPYYDAIPYADLSDFFYVWLKRMLNKIFPELFSDYLTPKKQEIVQLAERNEQYKYKTKENFEMLMTEAMREGRRVLKPGGLCVVVFAHKTTKAWETQLQAMINAGWVIVASWPIDTELATRLRGMNSAVLASSVHLVCRPRESADGKVCADNIGDWREVLNELPKRIHDWMPRLAHEGVVGADAIFACLGPALEIYSRYTSVEKSSGEKVALQEYLEHVWASVAREALDMIFQGADASGFEEDARLTAMWLWTKRTQDADEHVVEAEESAEAEEEATGNANPSVGAYILEYDAARKIAQGLGAHLEDLAHLVEIRGETAMLLPVGARTRYLFGKESIQAPRTRRRNAERQLTLDFARELEDVEEEAGILPGNLSVSPGATILDQLHQSMILFGAGRGEALKRFLIDEGIGRNPLFWRLAQALLALYPTSSEEKRWVEGVTARKKGLGAYFGAN